MIKSAIEHGYLSPDIKATPAAQFIEIAYCPSVLDTSLAHMLSRDAPSLERFAQALTELVSDPRCQSSGVRTPQIITENSQLALALRESRNLAPQAVTMVAFGAGMNVLAKALPEGRDLVSKSVLTMIGLVGARGEINAFSDRLLPGFVAFAPNNPAAAVAEQLVHECMHTFLWSYLQMDQDSRCALECLPALYSPFTRSPRSAIRIVHGVFSYGAVLALWNRLAGFAEETGWYDAQDRLDSLRKIEHRRSILQRRLQRGHLVLRNVIGDDDLRNLAANMKVSWALDSFDKSHQPNVGEIRSSLRLIETADIGPIEKAEALLAISGEKVSRLVLPLSQMGFLEFLGEAGIPYCLNNEAIVPAEDASLGGFSNVISKKLDIDSAPNFLCGYLYIGQNIDSVLEAERRDRTNDAADMFGIPRCCQEFFELNWEATRNTHGDLFRCLLEQSEEWRVDGYSECNAAAMYFGKGFCWHFPCSLHCEATAELIQRRLMILAKSTPIIASRLNEGHCGTLLWSNENGYAHVAAMNSGEALPYSLRWLSGQPFHSAGEVPMTAEDWARNAPSGEVRRALPLGNVIN